MSDPNRDRAAERAWHRLRVLCIGIGVAMAAADASIGLYKWCAAWLGLSAVNVWLDQKRPSK